MSVTATTPTLDTREAMTHSDWIVLAALASTAFLGPLNSMALNAFLPFIAEDLDTSVPVLGQITTLVFLLGALNGLLIGPLADRYGQRRFLMFGAAVVVGTSLGTAMAPNYEVLVGIRLFSALSGGILGAVTLASAASLFTEDRRRKAMSLVIAGLSCAPIVGVPLLTLIGSLWHWRVAFFVLAAIALTIMGLQRFILPPDQPADQISEPLRIHSFLRAYRPLIASRHMRAMYAASFARAVTWLGILIYLGSFLRYTYNLNEREIGIGYLLLGVGYFAGSLAAGRQSMSISLRPLYGVTSCAMAVMLTATMTLRLGVVVTLVMLAIATAIGGASYVCLTTLMVNESHAGRSTTMTLNSAVFSLGTAGGGAIGGALIAVSGYSALAIGLAGSVIVSALLVWNPLQRDSPVVPAESTS